MRPHHEYEEALRWIRWGLNDCQISRLTHIPLSTIRNWRIRPPRRPPRCSRCGDRELRERTYAYILGLYLGDGHLARMKNGVYRLSLACDARYPGIAREARLALSSLFDRDRITVSERYRLGCLELNASLLHWPCLFPQHGEGPKHLRPIRLERWQEAIVTEYPSQLLRGLIWSDGTRFWNRVRAGGREYAYVRYQFTNLSADIRAIFCRACDLSGISWRQSNSRTISISRRADVARLDSLVGPKF